MPDPATDKNVILDLIGAGVDRRDMVGRAKGDKGGLAIVGEFETDGLHPVGMHALDLKGDLGLFAPRGGIEDRDRAADFRADPEFGARGGEFGMTWPGIDQCICHDLAGFGIDPMRHIGGFGRGDGKLYAIDRATGEIRWRYVTYNPQIPDDPDGGGEVVTSPVYDRNGSIYFASWGEGKDETNAIYGIDAEGELLWRYPTVEESLAHRFFASPALDPNSETAYFSTFIASDTRADSIEIPGVLYAFDIGGEPGRASEQRLKWQMTLEADGDPIFTNTITVAADGTIYVGGWMLRDDKNVPVLFAVEDLGTEGRLLWATPYRTIEDGAQYVFGIALRETGGPGSAPERLFVTTGNSGAPLTNWLATGEIYAVDPATGEVQASYDPSDDEPTAIGGLNSPAIDREGRIYVGVRGHFRGPFAPNFVPGYYLALEYSDAARSFTPLWFYRTDSNYVEWTNPAIGPDGGIYAGSADHKQQDSVASATWPTGYAPEGTNPRFYGLKGPTSSVHVNSNEAFTVGTVRPNPVTDDLFVPIALTRRTDVRIELRDALGRTVVAPIERTLDGGERTIRVETAGLSSGSYFLTISDERRDEQRAIVITR